MRLSLLATGSFAVPVLERIAKAGRHDLVGVVTGPDKPTGRGLRLHPTPIRIAVENLGLPVLTPPRLKDPEFIESYRAWNPEAAVVVAFRILPQEIFDLPPYGTLNIHPSLLPRYRGPAPINRALINGEDRTGVSIFRITSEVDAGGLLLQRTIDIEPNATAEDLAAVLAPMGADLVLEALDGLAAETLKPIPQNESEVSKAPKLTREDGRIDWMKPAIEVHNRVRGVQPWPGAFTELDEKTLKLFRSRVDERISGPPGQVLTVGEELIVACGDHAVVFSEVQLEGKKRMPVSDFLRGYPLKPGTALGI